jgi:hypothetical protein
MNNPTPRSEDLATETARTSMLKSVSCGRKPQTAPIFGLLSETITRAVAFSNAEICACSTKDAILFHDQRYVSNPARQVHPPMTVKLPRRQAEYQTVI